MSDILFEMVLVQSCFCLGYKDKNCFVRLHKSKNKNYISNTDHRKPKKLRLGCLRACPLSQYSPYKDVQLVPEQLLCGVELKCLAV
jgi:hypothetical protein